MRSQVTTVFLCGDVMTGRGVDQILAHPSDPRLYEPAVDDASAYVSLAEEVSGEIPRSVAPAYIWGDALDELGRVNPDARVINLETAITRSNDYCKGKEIHYRMHPENVTCLGAAGVDIAVLANNHVLDWGVAGLVETIATLTCARIRVAGAGKNLAAARQPATMELDGGGRLSVFGFGSPTSGIPPGWAATEQDAGLDVLAGPSEPTAAEIADRVRTVKRPGDLVIASIHWGSNWGYDVPESFVRFAHRLIDGGVDLVHGHSSHHVRPIEIYRNRLILYGCGDFIDDYEGITGYGEFRGDLTLMYFAALDRVSGELVQLRMVPMRIRKLSLHRPTPVDARWLENTIVRISAPFGSAIERAADGALLLRWRS
jgi:poly-gamma-glutamate synthesis protein (capsule biosynthesis protein)